MGPALSPRFGFAYDPFGDGKTAIRGGFGVFRNRPLSSTGATNYDSYPIVQTPTVYYGTISTFRQAQGLISPPSVTAWDVNMKLPMVMNTSLSVQRNIGFGTVLDVGYVGSLGRHLSWSQELNNIPLGTRFNPRSADPTQPSVPLPDIFLTPIRGYNSITMNSAGASSNYHSLQVSANRRFAHGLQFGGAWTWSKAMDWTDAEYGSVNVSAPSFRAWNYGLAGFDRTHVVKLNWLYELPKRNWTFVPARAVLNGWQLSGVATFQSGAPLGISFTQVPAVDLTGTPSISARIQVNGDPVLSKDQRTINRAFDTSVFSAPPKGSLGDPSKVLLRGPGLNNWDLVLFKKFVIRERLHAQFRSEFFNAFNHTQFSTMGTAAQFSANGAQTNGQFGTYTAAQNPRIIQLAFRLQF
jgi:hypothetical protein